MAKAPTSRFVCQTCGAQHRKWSGKCDDCGAWNSIVEEAVGQALPKSVATGGRKIDFVALSGAPVDEKRFVSGIGEFDRVAGGGLVPGSATLVGGDPGIGKSTLLLQVAAALSQQGPAVYVSGEEAVDQVRMRARRMGLAEAPVQLAAATAVRDIVASLDLPDAPLAAVIDSIQTMFVDTLDSAPGTVAQVRAAAQELIRVAKRRGTALMLVGHVTKEGTIAGPRVLEHMVDTVLYFEGERGHHFRILRAVKNRFGPTDEIGVFEMTDRGLVEVSNPSALFLGDREGNAVSGAAVFAGMEGTRPLLVEIQALVAPTAFGTPRRAVIGWDAARLHMVLAVLEARCGVPLAGRDVYLNVAGGLKVQEPAADLAVAAALLSSLHDCPVPGQTVIFGEIGLSGEVRPVSQMESRLKEAAKLGFGTAVMPRRRQRGERGETEIARREISHLGELVAMFETDRALHGQARASRPVPAKGAR
jgi:DNA repair protein RadA/Sms